MVEIENEVDPKSPLSPITLDSIESDSPLLYMRKKDEKVDDLTTLSYLNDPSVLNAIKLRYNQSDIYTSSGIVLIAINPFERRDALYSHNMISSYAGSKRGELEPHLFAIAEDAYRSMKTYSKDQSIVVSGESGAGKTVSAKYIMRYFATVDSDANQHDMSDTEKQILATNPITEAFGNAKTTRNDNSSRFGKYLKILFDENKIIAGAEIKTYLLERSRLVFQPNNERNYHIFYQLFSGLDDKLKSQLHLTDVNDFFYVNQGKQPEIKGIDDKQEFIDTCEALSMVGVTETQQLEIFKILAGLLHIGNIEIKNSKGKPASLSSDESNLAIACELLGLDPVTFAKSNISFKAIAGKTSIERQYSSDQALNARDALAKFIYHNLFDWLVNQINKVLSPSNWPDWSTYEPEMNKPRKNFIGVLDIYGFEHFKTNSFEQFCINYANEKLQQEFIHRMFTLELQDYEREGIERPDLPFDDNKAGIDLIESKPGILALLDDESKMPQGNDETWEQNMHQILGTHEKYSKPKMGKGKFIVSHYALDVAYDTVGFVDKNRDSVSDTQKDVLLTTSNPFLLDVLTINDKNDVDSAPAKPGKRPVKPTLGGKFKKSLNELMSTINGSDVHYIRCIKPNEEKEAWLFDDQMVMSQLRACGVLASIQIYCQGFPSKMKFPEFASNFSIVIFSHEQRSKLMSLTPDEIRDCISNFLINTIKDDSLFKVGKTKVFFKAGIIGKIEIIKAEKQKKSAIIIQKYLKGHAIRKQYIESLNSLKQLQSVIKGTLTRARIQKQMEFESAVLIQSKIRSVNMMNRYKLAVSSLVNLQGVLRGVHLRDNIHREVKRRSAITIQSVVRGHLAKAQYNKYLKSVIFVQSLQRKGAAKREYIQLKDEAKNVVKLEESKLGLEQKVIDLTKSISEKTQDNFNLQQQIQNLSSLIKKSKTENQSLLDKGIEISSLHDTKVQDYETNILGLNEEINSVTLNFEEAKKQVEELTLSQAQIKDELKANIEELKQVHSKLESTEDERDTLAGVVEQLKTELKQLQEHLESNTFNNVGGTLGTISNGSKGLAFNDQQKYSSDSPHIGSTTGNDNDDDLERINTELMKLLDDSNSLHKEIVEGLFKGLELPTAVVASKPSRKEVLFPARIIIIILSDMWRLGLTSASETFFGEVLNMMQELVTNLTDKEIVQHGAFWLTNTHELYSFVSYAQSAIVSNEEISKVMGESEYDLFLKLIADAREDFESLSYNIFNIWIKKMMSILEEMIVPAIVLAQALPGFAVPDSSPLLSKVFQNEPKFKMDDVLTFFNDVYWAMKSYYFEPEVVSNVIRELLKFVNAYCFNDLIMRRNFLSWKRGLQLNYNVTRVDEWCKGHNITDGSHYLSHLFQVSKLLQLRKNTPEDIDVIYEICYTLKPVQIQKLFSQYHVADYETPISPMITQGLAEKVKKSKSSTDYFEPINKNSLFEDPFRQVELRPFNKIEAYVPARLNVPNIRRIVELATKNATAQEALN